MPPWWPLTGKAGGRLLWGCARDRPRLLDVSIMPEPPGPFLKGSAHPGEMFSSWTRPLQEGKGRFSRSEALQPQRAPVFVDRLPRGRLFPSSYGSPDPPLNFLLTLCFEGTVLLFQKLSDALCSAPFCASRAAEGEVAAASSGACCCKPGRCRVAEVGSTSTGTGWKVLQLEPQQGQHLKIPVTPCPNTPWLPVCSVQATSAPGSWGSLLKGSQCLLPQLCACSGPICSSPHCPCGPGPPGGEHTALRCLGRTICDPAVPQAPGNGAKSSAAPPSTLLLCLSSLRSVTSNLDFLLWAQRTCVCPHREQAQVPEVPTSWCKLGTRAGISDALAVV